MLIITGSIAWDYIMDFPGNFSDHILPDQIHKINLSFILSNFEKRRGGTAGNVSYTLGLLQITHKLLSTAGKDFGEYQSALSSLGIDTSGVKIYEKMYTATGFGMTDKTDNQIWGFYYGANEFVNKLKLGALVGKNDLVLIGPQGAKGSMSFVKQCVNLGIPYMFDPGFILTQVNDKELSYGVNNAKFVVGNDYEITLIKKRIKNFNQITKDKIIITTLGAEGALIENGNKKIDIKPARAEKVIDPSGAGDAWRAGFLAGLEKNFDLQICGQMGAITAVYAVENYGTQEHKFTIRDFTKRYRNNYNQALSLNE